MGDHAEVTQIVLASRIGESFAHVSALKHFTLLLGICTVEFDRTSPRGIPGQLSYTRIARVSSRFLNVHFARDSPVEYCPLSMETCLP